MPGDGEDLIGRRSATHLPFSLRRGVLGEEHRLIVLIPMTAMSEDKVAQQEEQEEHAPGIPPSGLPPLSPEAEERGWG
jgi:hypothetical protein